MSVFALNTAQEANGVSKLHGTVSQQMFQPLWKGYFPEENHWVLKRFDDNEDALSEDPAVVKILIDKEVLLNKQRKLFTKATIAINELDEPTGLQCDIFTSNFGDTQAALDYINKKLNGKSLMYGVKELFQGLAYNSRVNSYSALNLYYMQYKFPEIFGSDITLIYN